MALFPCTFKGHRYAGRQQSAYLTYVEGEAIATVKARLCPTHFRLVLETARERMDDPTEEPRMNLACRQCGETTRIFVSLRAFPTKSDEVQLVADLCEEHLSELHTALEANRWTPMAD